MSTDALLPLADAAGRQAGVWFVLLLLALLCGTALLGRLWQRHVWPRTHDGPPRPARLLLGLVAGFALLLGAAAVFAEIAERSSDGTGMARLDEALSLALRAHTGPRTLQLFRALTRLGDAAVLVPLSVVVALPLWWRGRAALALRVLPPRWHVPVLMLAAALAFSVGGSRVFLQLHYVSDVLAGFAWGAAWLALCVLSVELSRRWRRRR